MLKELKPAFVMLLALTVLTGILYPLLVTGIAQGLFPDAANGSLIKQNGNLAGSAMIGQPFSDPKYFWGRPSATGPTPYNAAAWQAPRIARLRGLPLDTVEGLVAQHTQGRQFGVLGEARVNVLQLNLALDGLRQ